MLAQAAGFAVLAALSPSALLVTTVYLGSARPRVNVLSYLAGGVLMSAVIAIAVLVAVRSGHLEYQAERTPRYGLRAGLGFLMVTAAVILSWRGLGRRGLGKRGPGPGGLAARAVASPGPLMAFAAGLVVFFPSLTFIAAVQIVATARAGLPLSALALVMVVCIAVTCVWFPYVMYLFAPAATARALAAFNGLLRAHGGAVVVAVLALAGAFLAVNGLTGLTAS